MDNWKPDPRKVYGGWFWFVPVWCAFPDDGLTMSPRHWSLVPLMSLAGCLESVRILVSSFVFADYEPAFMVKINTKPAGELVEELEA